MNDHHRRTPSMERHDADGSASSDTADTAAHDDGDELEQLSHRIEALRADLAQVDRRARALFRQRPLVAVAASLAVGFLLGRAIRRL
jgi:ElaB/YqjD/DUF883 family membrane-anchored ribosome-binding protein